MFGFFEKQGSRKRSSPERRTSRRLGIEVLEPRHMLSASGFHPDYHAIPHAGSSIYGYTPAQISAAYGFTKLSFGSTPADGRGQTIAIIDAYNDPNIAADLAAFDLALGIAAPPNLKIVNQNGGVALPGTDPGQGWEGETALDVEWAHAIAPGANILLVEANSASDNDLFAAVDYARHQAGVSVISMSWGSDDNLANQQFDQALSSQYLVTPAGHQGITFVASSGDDGHPSFPAESPNVLAVGGTDLYLNSNGTIANETAWTPTTGGGQVWSGGGGASQEFPGRNVPDVAYNAGVGMAVYDTFGPNHGWVDVGGTSAGAPQWAALIAIADEGRALNGQASLNGATQTLPAIFAAPAADFHDITTGSTQFQSAGPGYDLATGRGSPVANLLVPFLATYGTSGGTGSGGGTGGGTGTTTVPAAPSNFTAQAIAPTEVSLSWSASTGAMGYKVYEQVNGQAVLIGTLAAGTTSFTVNGLSPSTIYSFEVAAYNTAGATATSWTQVKTPTPVVTVTAPTNVAAAATSPTAAQVSWHAVTSATGYVVYEWNGSQAVQVAAVGAGVTSASIANQKPGSTEYFYVAAYNPNSSAASGWVSLVMPVAALVPPASLSASATSATSGKLSWSASAGATGYAIYYRNGAQTILLGRVSSGTTAVTIQGLPANSTSYFAIVAINGTTTSGMSNWVALKTPAASLTRSKTAAEFLFAQAASEKHPWWMNY